MKSNIVSIATRCLGIIKVMPRSNIAMKCGIRFSKSNELPEHIGIIMDGNRRFAKKSLKSLQPWEGHKSGSKNLEKLLRGILEERTFIKELTLYCFSSENFFRSETEVKSLLELFNENLDRIRKEEDIYEVAQLKFIGDLESFERVEDAYGLDFQLFGKMELIEEETMENEGLIVNFCCGYGGRNDVVRGIQNFATHLLCEVTKNENKTNNFEDGLEIISSLDEDNFMEYLGIDTEPNLIVRTGDRLRTSNFLAYQSVYSEWFFMDILWPEFTLDHLDQVIEEYINERKITMGR